MLVEQMAGDMTFLLPASLRPPPSFPPLLGSYNVETASTHPLINCILEILLNAKNLDEYVVSVQDSLMRGLKHSELERRLLRTILAQRHMGPKLLLHVDSCKFPLVLDELLVADLSTLKVLYVTVYGSFIRMRGAIDSTKIDVLFQRLTSLESLHVTSDDYTMAAHINSVFDNNGELSFIPVVNSMKA